MSVSNLPWVREACGAIRDIANNKRVKPETGLRNLASIQRKLDEAVRELQARSEKKDDRLPATAPTQGP